MGGKKTRTKHGAASKKKVTKRRASGVIPGDGRTWGDLDKALRAGLVPGVPKGTSLKDLTDEMDRAEKVKKAVQTIQNAEEEALREILDIEESGAWRRGGHKSFRDYLGAEFGDRKLKDTLLKRAAARVVDAVHDL